MGLLSYEIRKLFYQRTLLCILVFLLALNGFSFWNTQQKERAELIAVLPTYKQVLSECQEKDIASALQDLQQYQEDLNRQGSIRQWEQMGDEDMLNDLRETRPDLFDNWKPKYSGDIGVDSIAVSQVISQLSYLQNYEANVTKIQEQSRQLLNSHLFGNVDGFSHRNILKTAEDFRRLYQLPLKLDMDLGVVQAVRSGLTDVILMAGILLLALGLIVKEKNSGVLQLVRPTRYGRGRTLLAKLGLLTLGTTVYTILLCGINFAIAGGTFGFGDLNRYVQSINSFSNMEIVLKVWEYFALYLLSKVVVAIAVAAVIFAVLCAARNTITAYVILAVWLGGSYLLYTFVPANAYFNLPKYLNVFMFLNTGTVIKNYLNLNIFSFPVSLRILALILTILALGAAIAAAYFFYCRRGILSGKGFLVRVWERICGRFGRKRYSIHLFFHESYKLWIGQKGILAVVLLAAVLLYSSGGYNPSISDPDEAMYYQTVSLHSGPITEEPKRYVEQVLGEEKQVQQELDQAAEALAAEKITQEDYDAIVARKEGLESSKAYFQSYLKRYNELSEIMNRTGIEPEFIVDRSYVILFATVTDFVTDRYFGYANSFLLLFSAVTLGCAGMFCYENKRGSKKVLISTVNGRKRLIRNKLYVCLSYSVLCLIVSNAIYLYNIVDSFHVKLRDIPLQSIRGFENLPWRLSTYQALALQFGFQLLALLAVVMIVLVISEKSENFLTSLFISVVLMIVPLVLYSFGLESAQYISFYLPFLVYPWLQMESRTLVLILFALLWLCVFAAGLWYLHRRYRELNKRRMRS